MTTARRKPKNYSFFRNYTYFIPGVGEMFILLALLLLGALLGNIITSLFSLFMEAQTANEYGMLISYPVMFIPVMMYTGIKSGRNSCKADGIKLDSSHFKPVGGVACALIAAVATIALGFCVDAANNVLPKMPEQLEKLLESLTSGTLWINILMVSVFAPFFEEWLCRGMILRGLLHNKIKPVWAIIISAAFFAVIHLNPWQAVPALLLGGMFGYVYYKTGSLKLTMLMHCVNNSFAIIINKIPALEGIDNWMDVFSKPVYWIIFTACAIIAALAVLAFKKIPLIKSTGNSDAVRSLFAE